MIAERPRRWLALGGVSALLAALWLGCTTGAAGRRGGLSEPEITALPPEVQGSYELFAVRCSRCHTLERPLTASINQLDHWRTYVGKMRRQPGSGISETDAERILVFLWYWTQLRAERSRDPFPAEPRVDAEGSEP